MHETQGLSESLGPKPQATQPLTAPEEFSLADCENLEKLLKFKVERRIKLVSAVALRLLRQCYLLDMKLKRIKSLPISTWPRKPSMLPYLLNTNS